MTVWFTSDTHFNHANIIQYCTRPFVSVAEMDQRLIENWNFVVRHGDTVYHLGDFMLGDRSRIGDYLKQLNGTKHLILGNHDHKQTKLAAGWSSVHKMLELDIGHIKLVLCHYPLLSWNKREYGAINLHGHCHGLHASNQQQLDVGVDRHKFFPVCLGEIFACLENLPPATEQSWQRLRIERT